jgi:hypothetical protein
MPRRAFGRSSGGLVRLEPTALDAFFSALAGRNRGEATIRQRAVRTIAPWGGPKEYDPEANSVLVALRS